jgi:hypothetical protein
MRSQRDQLVQQEMELAAQGRGRKRMHLSQSLGGRAPGPICRYPRRSARHSRGEHAQSERNVERSELEARSAACEDA